MAITLVTTLSSDNANSYADVSYCDAYWEQHYSTIKSELWSALTEPQKVLLLVQACRAIERLRFTVSSVGSPDFQLRRAASPGVIVQTYVSPKPVKAVYTQALQFPRNIDTDIPEPIKLAQCEQAVYLLSFDDSVIAAKLQGIDSEKTTVGAISVSQSFSGSGAGTMLSPMALEYVGPYLLRTSSSLRRS